MIALLTVVLALQAWTPPPVSELTFAEAYACTALATSARSIEFPDPSAPLTPQQQSLWDDLTTLQVAASAAADLAAQREGLGNRPAEEALVREQIVEAGDEKAMQILVRCMMVFGLG